MLDTPNEDFGEIANEVEAQIEADFLPVATVNSDVIVAATGATVEAFAKHNGGNARIFARYEG